MRRLFLAFQAFLRILSSGATADQIDLVLRGKSNEPTSSSEAQVAPVMPSQPPRVAPIPTRSEALTLLAALQREARLLDLIMESLDSYSDAQVGGAARNVLKDSRAVIDRLFGLTPTRPESEGAEITIPAAYDVGLIRLTGKLAANPPSRGRLVHPGWSATKCEIPVWSGSKESALVVMPAEVEVA